jgi:N-acetylglucosaminyl-diphospho-decaprenol L-rhamnosyltransferase
MLVLSIVSHRQTELVNLLLEDLVVHGKLVDLVILTLNVFDEDVPEAFSAQCPWGKRLVRNAVPQGFGANHNAAFQHCFEHTSLEEFQRSCFVIANPDIRISDSKIFSLAPLALKDNIALVAPNIIENGRSAASARALYTPLQAFLGLCGWRNNHPDKPDWLSGAFLLVNAQVFRRLAGFDTKFFLYCEDVDLCLRVQMHGYRIAYLESVEVEHAAQRSSHKSIDALQHHLTSAFKLWTSAVFWRFLLKRF